MILSLKKIGEAVEELARDDEELKEFLISMMFDNGKRDLKKETKDGTKIFGIAFRIDPKKIKEGQNAIVKLEDEKIENTYESGYIILKKQGNVSNKIGEIRIEKELEKNEVKNLSAIKKSLKTLLSYREEEINKIFEFIKEEIEKTFEKEEILVEKGKKKIKVYIKLDLTKEEIDKIAKKLTDEYFEEKEERINCSVCGEYKNKSEYSIREILKFFTKDKKGYLGTSFKSQNEEEWLRKTFEVCKDCTKKIVIGWKYLEKNQFNFGENKIKIIPNENSSNELFKIFVYRFREDSEDLIFKNDRLGYIIEKEKEKNDKVKDLGFHIYIMKEQQNESKIIYVINSELNYVSNLSNKIKGIKPSQKNSEKYKKFIISKQKSKEKNLNGYIEVLSLIFRGKGKSKLIYPYGEINIFKLIEFILDKSNKNKNIPLQFYKNIITTELSFLKGKTDKKSAEIILHINFLLINKIMELILKEKNMGDIMKDNEWYEWARKAGSAFRKAVEVQRIGGNYNEKDSTPPLLKKINKSLFSVKEIMRLIDEANKIVIRYSNVKEGLKEKINEFENEMFWLSKKYNEIKDEVPNDKTKISYNFLMGYYGQYYVPKKEGGDENE